MLEKFTTLDEVHDKVNAVRLLEDVVHANDEWMVDLVQDELLNLERLDGLMLDDDILADNLHRVELVLPLVPHEVDFAEGAASNDTDQLEVIPGHLCHRGAPVQQR